MKKFILLLFLPMVGIKAFSQELYVNTEPASNMARGSVGIRLENQGYFEPYRNRSTFEVMVGASKNIMVHGAAYLSNFYRGQQNFEGGSAYLKYRFLSVDTVQKHFRGAFFAKAAAIKNPVANQELSLEGDNTGLQSGLIFTQLIHKLALSGSASYIHAYNNSGGYAIPGAYAKNAIAYTASAGYLLLPKTYTSYDQTNLNLYFELLGKTNPGYGQSYLDAAPAAQLIINSVFRIDLSYRLPLYDNMSRNSKNMYLVRLEYNLFNVF